MKREPVVTIFVRHNSTCNRTGDRPGCDCPKWLRWSLDGQLHRESTGTRSWERAEEMRREKQDGLKAGKAIQTREEAKRTLAKARDLFLLEKQTEGVSHDVYKKYERETERFVKYCDAKGKFFPADIDKAVALEYRSEWDEWYPSSQTRSLVQVRFKQFLRFMHEEGWLPKLPKLKAIKVDVPPTMPLTDEQYARLLGSIEKVGQFPRRHEPAHIHALIQLMRHTGLAITDAVTLQRSELVDDQGKGIWRVATARQKTGVHVSVPLPKDVAREVLTVLNGNPRFIFWHGEGIDHSAVTNWQHDLRHLFRAAFGPATRFTPHCLRDTFAVGLLSAGVPIEEVSKALGHSSVKTTEKSYAPWVRARQDRLDSLIVATWQVQP